MTRPSDETIKEVAALLRAGDWWPANISALADRLDPPPLPIAVGDRMRTPGGECDWVVVALDGNELWMKSPNGYNFTFRAGDLTRIEDGA